MRLLNSPLEVDHLLQLARNKSATARQEIGQIMSDLFLGNLSLLTERERNLMFDILLQVVHDIEMSVRRTISEHLAKRTDVPRGLVKLLANDQIEIAYPILAHSRMLEDADLIEVIRQRTLEHQLAIAIRDSVSEAVSDALVQTGRERVIVALLKNPNARISDTAIEYLVEQSRRVDTFQEPILRRSDLDPGLAQRMFMWVSAALRQFVLDSYPLDAEVVDDLLERVAVESVAALTAPGRTPSKAAELAAKLHESKAVTPDLLIAVLQEGEVSLFISMFQRLTDLRENLVRRMAFEPGGEGLAIACKAAGLGKATFSAIFALTRKARPGAERTLARDLRLALAFYDRISETGAHQVVVRWKRNMGYQAAIRELELNA